MTIPLQPYELPAPTLASRLADTVAVLSDPHLNPATRIRFAHSHVQHVQFMLQDRPALRQRAVRALVDAPGYTGGTRNAMTLLKALDAAGLALVPK